VHQLGVDAPRAEPAHLGLVDLHIVRLARGVVLAVVE
jgi:hypothetical protein